MAIAALAARHIAVILRHLQDLELDGRDLRAALVKDGIADQRTYVVTSVLTTAALLLPAAVLGGRLGLEIISPLAVTVLVGLISLTAVDLIVVPVMYRFVRAHGGKPPKPADDLDSHAVPLGERLDMTHPWSRRTRVGLTLAAVATRLSCPRPARVRVPEEEEEVELFQTKLVELKDFPGHHSVTFSKVGRAARRRGDDASHRGRRASRAPVRGAALQLRRLDVRVHGHRTPDLSVHADPPAKVVEDGTIVFTGGPKPGTPVVTSGVPQVHGADIQLEFGEIA